MLSAQAGCLPFSQAAVDRAVAFITPKKPDGSGGVMIISNYFFGHFSPGGRLARQFRRPDGSIAADSHGNLAAWVKALGTLASRLQAHRATLIVVAPTPEQRNNFNHPQLSSASGLDPPCLLPAAVQAPAELT